MPDVAEIAGRLSEAQREAVMSASPTFGGQMQVWHAHRSTIKSVHRKGFCTEPDWKGCAIETPLGLAVRVYLENSRVTD